MHDARSYAEWNEGSSGIASVSFARSADELRAEAGSHRILSVDEAIDLVRTGHILHLTH
jgi:hypothetical protein